MKRILRNIIVLTVVILGIAKMADNHIKRSDDYIRDRVLLLQSPVGTCSGVEVRAPSGKVYVLTAAHCRGILINDRVTAKDEQGRDSVLQKIAEDRNSDLLLLGSPNGKYIDVAKRIYSHQHVHAMTHGAGFPSYRTDGELLDLRVVDFDLGLIRSVADMANCAGPKYTVGVQFDGRQASMVCHFSAQEMYTTAAIIPGSSGGPLLDDDGELVGIASATNGVVHAFVTLSDIQAFLAKR